MAGPDIPSPDNKAPATAPTTAPATQPSGLPLLTLQDMNNVDSALAYANQEVHRIADMVPHGDALPNNPFVKHDGLLTVKGQGEINIAAKMMILPAGTTQADTALFNATIDAVKNEIPDLNKDVAKADALYTNVRQESALVALSESLKKIPALTMDSAPLKNTKDLLVADIALVNGLQAMAPAVDAGKENGVIDFAHEFINNPEFRRGVEYNAPSLSAHLMSGYALQEVDQQNPNLSQKDRIANAQAQIDKMFGQDARQFSNIVLEAKNVDLPSQSNVQLNTQTTNLGKGGR